MSPYYRRRRSETEDTVRAAAIAAAAAAGVGAVTFYLARILLSREPLTGSRSAPDDRPDPEARPGEAREG